VTAPLFFADADRLRAARVGEVVELGGAEGHHAATVRRLAIGERLDLSDGAGLVCAAEVTAVQGHGLQARLVDRREVERPQPRVSVVQALAKGDRDERAVESMTEVGVDMIVPWQAGRCVVRWDHARAEKSLARWRSTAREAAKQSRRPWLVDVPSLESTAAIVSRLRLAAEGGGVAVVLHEGSDRSLAQLATPHAGDVVLVVGPEGGIADDEVAAFEAVGAVTCKLGSTVLRTSTAGAVAAAVVMANSGRWS
jgi:16S rRNA (uracil1498-N3)-methyltransferase